MKIGVLSDTHGVLVPQIFKYFDNCDEIWHAGDIGSLDIAEKLADFKPVKIVYGNIDSSVLRIAYPHTQKFQYQGLRICITHIAGIPPTYNTHVQEVISTYNPHMLVCGHSHILRIERDPNGMLYVNPGAVGNYGRHSIQTILRFDIIKGKAKNMEAIEIGRRNPS